MSDPQILSAADIARMQGWSRTTAWNWLRSLPETFIVRRGPKKKWVGITREKLDAILRGAREPIDDRIERRLADLERRMGDAETRADGLATAIHGLRKHTTG